MIDLKTIIKNHFENEETKKNANDDIKNIEKKVLFMIKELHDAKKEHKKIRRPFLGVYFRPVYAYAFALMLIILGLGLLIPGFTSRAPGQFLPQVPVGNSTTNLKSGMGSDSVKIRVTPTPTPTPIPTTTQIVSPSEQTYYIADLLSYGNIYITVPNEEVKINTILKSYQQWNNFTIVTNQSDFSYKWSIDDPNIANIGTFKDCTNGITTPCPEDHLVIAAKKEGATYVRVGVTKKSGNLLVTTSTFNLVVKYKSPVLTPKPTTTPILIPTLIPTIKVEPLPSITPTPLISTNCNSLLELIKKSYSSNCGQANYDTRADINKDGLVNGADFSALSGIMSHSNSDNECALKLANTTPVCP